MGMFRVSVMVSLALWRGVGPLQPTFEILKGIFVTTMSTCYHSSSQTSTGTSTEDGPPKTNPKPHKAAFSRAVVCHVSFEGLPA